MNRIYLKSIILLIAALLFSACEDDEKTPPQIERDKIMAIENLLRDNQWGFNNLSVTIQFETQALPLLANVADENGMVQPGIYDSYAIFGNNKRQLDYTYEFLRDDILLDTTNQDNFLRIGGYYVLNTEQIRIRLDSVNAIVFNYTNQEENNKFALSTSSIYKEDFIAAVNQRIIDAILLEKPNDISRAIVDFLLNNENLRKAIDRFLYDLLHGKIEEITQSPEELAERLARLIVEKLKEIDWEEVLYERILEFLQNLQAEDPEDTASELARRMADKIEASLSLADIYDTLLPIMQNIENEVLPVLSSRIAAAVYEKIASELSEENIYNRVYPIWEDFTGADSIQVSETADSLAAIASARFFDADTLTEKLMPFVQSIADTPTRNLTQLAQEIIDTTLIPIVDQLNEAFPGLGLDPNWTSIKPVITSVLTAIKAKLGTSTVEELSADLADAIISIMEVVLREGFEAAIYSLQEIPADQAASVIASWLTNLIEMVEQPVIDFIEGKLNEIFKKFEAEKAAQALSVLIHDKILEVFSEENLYNLFLPVLQAFQEADIERIARTISRWIVDTGLLPDDLTEEDLVAALALLLEDLIAQVDPDEATQNLLDFLRDSDLVKNIDGKILKEVLTIKIYELYGRIAGSVNAIEGIELVIELK